MRAQGRRCRVFRRAKTKWCVWALLMLLPLVIFGSGCAGKNRKERKAKGPEIPPGPVIKKVEVEGVTYFDEETFLGYLNLQPTGAFSFGSKHYYVPGLEAIDAQRIPEVYAAHGHYDTEVVSIEVETEIKGNQAKHARKVARRARKGKPPPKPLKEFAYAKIVVAEGTAAKVRSRKFTWAPFDEAGEPLDRAKVEELAKLDEGDVFEIPKLTNSALDMRFALRERGYAHADVIEHADVHTEEKWADISFEIVPGDAVSIGEITVVGLDLVPPDLVEREYEFARGERFSPSVLTRIEQAVYAMEVFSAVSIVEGPPKENGTIDLKIQVQETKLQSFKVGVGFGIDPIRWDQRGVFKYRHDSIFGRLTRMDIELKAGYAELPAIYDPQEHGPVASLEFTFRKKGILEKNLVWTEKPSIELGIWPGYQYWQVKNRIGVTRFFTKYLETGLSYNNRFTDFFNVSPALTGEDTLLGANFRDPYFLSYIALELTLHLVDDMVSPKNGARLKFGYDVANRYFGSQYNAHRIPIELQLFYRPVSRFQLAGRAKVGFILPYGKEEFAGLPIDAKWYLGGAYDVRGWPLRQLSPRVESCDYAYYGSFPLTPRNCEQIPVGGYSMVLFNVEPRVRVVSDLWLAAFFDVGDVRDDPVDFVPAGWQMSTGGGLRYESPIGSIRLDFGWRLTKDDARFPVAERFLPNSDNYAIHIAIGEVF